MNCWDMLHAAGMWKQQNSVFVFSVCKTLLIQKIKQNNQSSHQRYLSSTPLPQLQLLAIDGDSAWASTSSEQLNSTHCSSPLFLTGWLNLPALFLPILCFVSEVEVLNNEICYHSLTCLSPSFELRCFLGLCASTCLWLVVDKAKPDSWVQPSKHYKTYVNAALILQQNLASLEHSLNKCHFEQKICMYMITWSSSFKPCSCPLQSIPEKEILICLAFIFLNQWSCCHPSS